MVRIATSTTSEISRLSGSPTLAPPAIQLTPTGTRLMPVTVMTVPVTTGGNRLTMRPTSGASAIVTAPAAMTEPNRPVSPMAGAATITVIGGTAANVTPIISGRRMPNFHRPADWMTDAMPHANRSALMSIAMAFIGNFATPPIRIGMAMAPGPDIVDDAGDGLFMRIANLDAQDQFGEVQPHVAGSEESGRGRSAHSLGARAGGRRATGRVLRPGYGRSGRLAQARRELRIGRLSFARQAGPARRGTRRPVCVREAQD